MDEEEAPPVRRYLVVANQTLGGAHLLQAIQARNDAGPSEFHIVVPATPARHQLVYTEGGGRRMARERLHEVIGRLDAMGVTVTGEVGDPSPMTAIGNALRSRVVDEVIVSTLPLHLSRWIRQDLPRRVQRTFHLPVCHVVPEAVDA